jgi:hypothetical protein
MLPQLSGQELDKFRPDILYIQGGNPDIVTNSALQTQREGMTIHIVEVGYGADTRYTDKLQEKTKQHVNLVRALRQAGWTVADPHIIILGSGATIYKDLAKFLRSTLGLRTAKVREITHQLIRHAALAAHSIIGTRRCLERGEGPPPSHNHSNDFKGRRKRPRDPGG